MSRVEPVVAMFPLKEVIVGEIIPTAASKDPSVLILELDILYRLALASPPKVKPLAAKVEPAPPTDNRVVGEAVPIPTFPSFVILTFSLPVPPLEVLKAI